MRATAPSRRARRQRPWVSVFGTGHVVAVDPSTGKVVRRVRVPGQPEGIVAAFGAIWVVRQQAALLTRVASDGKVGPSYHLGEEPRRVTAGSDALFASNFLDGTITRVDPKSGAVRTSDLVCTGAQGMVVVGDALWVTCTPSDKVVAVDIHTLKPTGEIKVTGEPDAILVVGSDLYVATTSGPTLVRIHPDPQHPTVLSTSKLGNAPPLQDQANVDAVMTGGRCGSPRPARTRCSSTPPEPASESLHRGGKERLYSRVEARRVDAKPTARLTLQALRSPTGEVVDQGRNVPPRIECLSGFGFVGPTKVLRDLGGRQQTEVQPAVGHVFRGRTLRRPDPVDDAGKRSGCRPQDVERLIVVMDECTVRGLVTSLRDVDRLAPQVRTRGPRRYDDLVELQPRLELRQLSIRYDVMDRQELASELSHPRLHVGWRQHDPARQMCHQQGRTTNSDTARVSRHQSWRGETGVAQRRQHSCFTGDCHGGIVAVTIGPHAARPPTQHDALPPSAHVIDRDGVHRRRNPAGPPLHPLHAFPARHGSDHPVERFSRWRGRSTHVPTRLSTRAASVAGSKIGASQTKF